VFAHLLLAPIKPTLLSHRRMQQSGFTPGCSTCDHILTVQHCPATSNVWTLNIRGLCRSSCGFWLLSRPALWLLLKWAGVPEKIVTLIRALYDCVRANGLQSIVTWFEIMSGVRRTGVRNVSTRLPQAWIYWRSVGIGMNGALSATIPTPTWTLPTT